MQVLTRQTSICAKLTCISQRLHFRHGYGKTSSTTACLWDFEKVVIYFSCVKYFQTFAFFPPLPVDLFSSYYYVDSSIRCTFQQNKKAHRLLSFNPTNFSCLWVSVLDNILLLFCYVPTRLFLYGSLKYNVFENANIYNSTLHLRNYHPRKTEVVWIFTSYLRSEVRGFFCTINDFACFCILLCLLVQNNEWYIYVLKSVSW